MRKLFVEYIYEEEPTNMTTIERQNYFKINFTNKYEYLLSELLELIKVGDSKDIEELKAGLRTKLSMCIY
jgi:hypothetical protein